MDEIDLSQSRTGSGLIESAHTDTAALLGQVMFLVAVAIAFLAAGSWIGRDLSESTATILFFVGFGMLMASNFADGLRHGLLGVTWLYVVALLWGLGLGPALNQIATVNPDVITTAAAGTALATVGAGAIGFLTSKDLSSWMRPLSFVILGAVGVSFVLLLLNTGAPVLLSFVILAVSTLLIVVDFNYLRKRGTEQDAVWLATGIFVSIVNIFLSLLNILGR